MANAVRQPESDVDEPLNSQPAPVSNGHHNGAPHFTTPGAPEDEPLEASENEDVDMEQD